MKSYKERTDEVVKKVEEYNNKSKKSNAVDNGGGTLSVKRNKAVILWTAFAAACLAILIALNLVLFLPFPVSRDISAYKDSEYYGLINVVNGLTYKKPKYKNNFEKLFSFRKNSGSDGVVPPATPDAPTSPAPPNIPDTDRPVTSPDNGTSNDDNSGNGDYVENTNNQVNNVIEGDILKCSSKYAFYLVSGRNEEQFTLNVYTLDGKASHLASSYTVKAEKGTIFNYVKEMYLSSDCNTATVITHYYNKNIKQYFTCLISLDVSNVSDIKETARIYVSGQCVSARLKDNSLLLFTNFRVNNNPDFSDEAQFVPQTGELKNMRSLPVEDIIYSDDARSANYTVVCAIDQTTLEINSSYAFLSYSQNAYVSEDNIYLTRTKNPTEEHWDDGSFAYYGLSTQITCISYADGKLTPVNSAEVHGIVLNQYSMDEHEGVLRVVTEGWINRKFVDENSVTGFEYEYYSGANLYCIDLESFEICASLEKFSPSGESVFSVRFDGATAYVCTAVEYANYLHDPVFAIDLTDLDNITYKDTGTITGYSLSLTKFKDDTLVGIGYGEWLDQLKIELYRETDDGVECVTSYVKNCDFSSEFKSYFIDAENGLVGLSVLSGKDGFEYLLLLFDGYELSLVESVVFDNNIINDYTRTLYLDGYIYVFTYDFTDNGAISVIDWNA